MTDIRAKSTYTDDHLSLSECAQVSWQIEQFECLFEGDCLNRLRFLQGSELWLLLLIGDTYLCHGTVTANLHRHLTTRLGISAQYSFTHLVFDTHLHCLLHDRMKLFVKTGDRLIPLCLPLSYFIKLFLYFRSKVKIHHGREVLHKEIIHNDPYVSGNQLIFVGTGNLGFINIFDVPFFECQDIEGALHSLHNSLLHIFPVHDGGDGRGVGGRTSYTQLFHLTDKRCLRKS